MRRILLYLCLALLPLGVAAQSGVVVTAKTDSMMLMIGQQTGIHLEVTCDAGRDVTFPPYRDTIVTGLEILPPVLTDTQYVNEGKRMTIFIAPKSKKDKSKKVEKPVTPKAEKPEDDSAKNEA